MRANSSPRRTRPIRYNPNSERGDILQVVAANWEVLRRAPLFRQVAENWVKSEAFRFGHIAEGAYRNNGPARCALDWMLTVGQRITLANYQMDRFLFKWEPELNYGPIIVLRNPGRQNRGLRECIRELFTLLPNPDPRGVLSVDQPWPATPEKFRSQFLSDFDKADLKEIMLEEHGVALSRIGSYTRTRDLFVDSRRSFGGVGRCIRVFRVDALPRDCRSGVHPS